MLSFFRKKTQIIPRPQHNISRKNIERGVINILYRLKNAGYQGCLVGGCVRDILVGRSPKDFDIATDAKPEELKRLFRRARLIGKRFRLAHIYLDGRRFVEVATFRRQPKPGEVFEEKHGANNLFGTIEEDALRRDFTVNALYYNIADFSILDFTGGIRDLKRKRIRVIGDPATRLEEDPGRIIRAARFAGTFNFSIGGPEMRAMKKYAHLVGQMNAHRLLEELYKILKCGASAKVFTILNDIGAFPRWFPDLAAPDVFSSLIRRLTVMDTRVSGNPHFPSAIMLASLMYDYLENMMKSDRSGNNGNSAGALPAFRAAFNTLAGNLRIAKKERSKVRHIIANQWRLGQPVDSLRRLRSRKAFVKNENFRASMIFFEIDSQAFNRNHEVLSAWQKEAEQWAAENTGTADPRKGKPRPHRRRRRPPRKTNEHR